MPGHPGCDESCRMTTQTPGATAPENATAPQMPAPSAHVPAMSASQTHVSPMSGPPAHVPAKSAPGAPVPAAWPPVVPPAEPRSYVHQMRGPRYRWWRPVVALGVAAVTLAVLMGVLMAGFMLSGAVPMDGSEPDMLAPGGFLSGNVIIGALLPATMVGLWAGFEVRPGRVFSVAGRMRWGWLGRCLAILAPLWATYIGVSWVVMGGGIQERPEQWLGLLVIALLTTPLQAAAEEVAFRGGLVQGVGAWFRSPVVALVVTTLLSAALFGLAHGSLDLWILLDLGFMAAAGCWLSWRTGGLEAIIALHVANNLLVTAAGLVFGGLADAYIDTGVTSTPLDTAMSIAMTSIVAALLLRSARRQGIAPQGWREPALG